MGTDADSQCRPQLLLDARTSGWKMQIAVLIGSAAPPGRTHAVASVLAERLTSRGSAAPVIDLREIAFEPADGRPLDAHDATIRDAVATLHGAAAVVVVSPVYRATYTGVLKNFLDIVPLDALRDRPIGLAVVGASPHHYLGVDLGLRAVWAWFGALAAPTSVYVTGTDFDDRKQLHAGAAAQLDGLAETVVSMARSLAGARSAPPPLASR